VYRSRRRRRTSRTEYPPLSLLSVQSCAIVSPTNSKAQAPNPKDHNSTQSLGDSVAAPKNKSKRSEKRDNDLRILLGRTNLVWNRTKIEFDEINFIPKHDGDAVLVGDGASGAIIGRK
jgi:hypothetical protein